MNNIKKQTTHKVFNNLPKKAISCTKGQTKVFTKDRHTIIHGDSVEAMQHIEDSSIDLIFADPPYNIGKDFDGFKDKWNIDDEYLEWCYRWLDLCIKKLSRNGSFYVMTSTQYMPFFDIYLRKKMDILSRIVWHYDSSGVQAKNITARYMNQYYIALKIKITIYSIVMKY